MATVVTKSAKGRLNIAIDSDVKQEVGVLLHDMGLDYTTAVNLFFKTIIRERRIPFEIGVRQNLTVDEFLGADWRQGLEGIEDEWD